jgi:protein-tyrosine-phosphatase
MPQMKPTVLILCSGNSCRSHLAEGILHAATGDLLDAQSAGSKPAGYVHPLAIEVMKEISIDISSHRSKHMDVLKQPVDRCHGLRQRRPGLANVPWPGERLPLGRPIES